jgi:hypothetical protein
LHSHLLCWHSILQMYSHQQCLLSCRIAVAFLWLVLRPVGTLRNQRSGMMCRASRTASYMILRHTVIHLDFVHSCFMVSRVSVSLCCFSPVARTLYPPQHTCTNTSCSHSRTGKLLKKEEQWQAVLYTMDKGAVPVCSVHLYCDGIQTIDFT